jgi:hypothetical protein
MGKKSTPKPPDYEAAAERTAEGNIALVDAQTADNRPDQYTPWGASEWIERPDGTWEQSISLTNQQQQALDDQMNIQGWRSGLASDMFGRVNDEFGGLMDWDQFGDYTSDLSTGAEARQQGIDNAYDQYTRKLDPQWEQRMEQKEAALRNQGLNPGDEAYDYAMADIGRERTDAYDTAMRSSIGIGGAEGQRDQAMDLTAGNFGNQVRQAQIAEEMQARGFSLNEINAILSGQQIGMPSMPGFNTAERAQGADYNAAANSQWGADMDAFSAQQAQAQMLMEGITGAAGMFPSDARLKTNIEYMGEANGRKWYTWDWILGGSDFGVIAQENMDMVAGTINGFMVVDYGRV